MTNTEIIFEQTALLIKNGKLTENNIIDTVPGWNKKGYKVNKGAEHVAAFAIWMPRTKKKNQTDEELAEEIAKKGRFYLKTAYWFTDTQVEKMKK